VKDSVQFNMTNFLKNFDISEQRKQLESNSKLTRHKVLEIDESLMKRYGHSENLHSFKNTPNQLKVLPSSLTQT
jgi:hypothetical protein